MGEEHITALFQSWVAVKKHMATLWSSSWRDDMRLSVFICVSESVMRSQLKKTYLINSRADVRVCVVFFSFFLGVCS